MERFWLKLERNNTYFNKKLFHFNDLKSKHTSYPNALCYKYATYSEGKGTEKLQENRVSKRKNFQENYTYEFSTCIYI